MKRSLLLPLFVLFVLPNIANEYDYKFRLKLHDKGASTYSLKKPQEFLSQKAIDRRNKQKIEIEYSDLPISQDYLKSIEEKGVEIVAKSKWLNTVSVHCKDSDIVEILKQLPFVEDITFVWRGKKKADLQPQEKRDSLRTRPNSNYPDYYGFAATNTKLENGHHLHQAGYKGEGMEIAVIDAGFSNLLEINMLDNVKIKGWKGFIHKQENIFDTKNQHGLNVFSCMATNKPHEFVGTAPEASYWLLNTEDSRSEYPIEEDYWVAAAEYADSVGVDLINSSLGYAKFDFPAKSTTHEDLNGKNTFISRGATMAARKGIFVVCSAGNSGDGPWEKITPPADAEFVLTVGAAQKDSIAPRFTSKGFTADMRVKPDVTALGLNTAVIGEVGFENIKSGTSFSSPIMCGLVACLWQAYPTLTNRELLNIVIESSNRFDSPDPVYGYGIPDMKKAMEIAQNKADAKSKTEPRSRARSKK